MAFPDWKSEDYKWTKGCTKEEMAWELLRRNRKFLRDLQRLERGAKTERAVLVKWGLKQLKPAEERFDDGARPLFTGRLRSLSFKFKSSEGSPREDTGSHLESRKVLLRDGEVAIVFNARFAITPQLTWARERLERRGENWGVDDLQNPRQSRSNTPFARILRLADALKSSEMQGLSGKKKAALLYGMDEGDWKRYRHDKKLFEYYVDEKGYLMLAVEARSERAEAKSKERKATRTAPGQKARARIGPNRGRLVTPLGDGKSANKRS